jgi:hypothetical protein
VSLSRRWTIGMMSPRSLRLLATAEALRKASMSQTYED